MRKISGSNKPSKANAEAFERAVEEVAASTAALLDSLVDQGASPKNREVEAQKTARPGRRAVRRGLTRRGHGSALGSGSWTPSAPARD